MPRQIRPFLVFLILALAVAGRTSANESAARIVTFNVLADPIHAEVRLPAIFALLEKSNADIIGLQEVAPWFLAALEKQPWAKDYHSPMADGRRLAPGGLLILSRSPILAVSSGPLDSRQRRSFLVVETKLKDVPVKVANCHLESPLESGGLRASQLDHFFGLLSKAENALFLGDFNFGDGEQPETARLPPDYLDAWRTTNGKDPGFTWNIEKSPMAKTGSFPNEPSRRLDRILVRSKRISPSASEILGHAEIPGHPGVFPSDHFGLLGTFKVAAPASP